MKLAYHKTVSVGDIIELYGAKRAYLRTSSGFFRATINDSNYAIITTGKIIEFPIIDGKSPNVMTIVGGTASDVDVEIYELGGTPSDDYGKE